MAMIITFDVVAIGFRIHSSKKMFVFTEYGCMAKIIAFHVVAKGSYIHSSTKMFLFTACG